MGILQTSSAVLWLLTWLASPPSSLGDAAMREAIRRQSAPKASATLTNLGRPIEPPPPAAVSLPPPPEPAARTDVMPPPPPNPEVKPAEPPKDEAWWRGRITAAKQSLAKNQTAADSLQTRINALQRDAVNIDDPLQQNRARQELGKALGELERARLQIEADQKTIIAIRDEARRLDVPPGWIR